MRSHTLERLLFWSPRVIGLLFALFLGIFALDVFGMSDDPREVLVGLLIHLIPTWALLFCLLVAWWWELPGALLFFGCGVYFGLQFGPQAWLLIPVFLVGLMFLLHWKVGEVLKRKLD